MINKILLTIIFGIFFLFLTCISIIGMSVPCKAETFTAPRSFSLSNVKEWILLGDSIIDSKDPVVSVLWSGVGGVTLVMDTFNQKIDLARKRGKYIVFILDGPAYSCHAFTACRVDKIEYGSKYFLMFHRLATSLNIVLTNKSFIDYLYKTLQPCVDRGILREEDRKKTMTKYEVYVRENPDSHQIERKYKLDPRQ